MDLPDWEFYELEAKMDTGAFTSSLHCHKIQPFEKEGKPWIRFCLLDPDHDAYSEQELEMPLHDTREVKSSNGEAELRYFVKTRIEFFGDLYDIEFSLTDRSAMKYPLLIGRKFLRRGPFMVDVTSKNLSHSKKTKES